MEKQPPPYGMAPPPYPPTSTTREFITTTEVVVLNFGPEAQTCTCPSCHAQILTRVDREATAKTHLFAILLCLICCPLVCVPYCTDSCLSVNHYCPNCGAFLGSYDK